MNENKRELPEDTERRTGRSTRQADEIIQNLFKDETVFFRDHAAREGNMANHCLSDKILTRMSFEHPHRAVYFRSYGTWTGMTIKFVEDRKEEALSHLNKEWSGKSDSEK